MVVVLDVAPRAGYRIWLPYSDGASGDVDLSDEALIYRHLGDWIVRQKADREHGVEGADGRLAARYDLQNQLAKIIGGELPCDLFVRWRPLGEPPIGWEPDINDDVRINILPFMLAELTRGGSRRHRCFARQAEDRLHKDGGEEALQTAQPLWRPPWLEDDDDRDGGVNEDQELRPPEDYPWFWACPSDGTRAERTDSAGGSDFDGNRWDDLHYTNAMKRAARSRRMVEASS